MEFPTLAGALRQLPPTINMKSFPLVIKIVTEQEAQTKEYDWQKPLRRFQVLPATKYIIFLIYENKYGWEIHNPACNANPSVQQ